MASANSIQDVLLAAPNAELILQHLLTGLYTVGGETVDLTALADNPGAVPEGFFENPLYGGVFAKQLNGYLVELIPGTALNNWKLKVFTVPGTEMGAVTYASLGMTSPNNVVYSQFLRRNM